VCRSVGAAGSRAPGAHLVQVRERAGQLPRDVGRIGLGERRSSLQPVEQNAAFGEVEDEADDGVALVHGVEPVDVRVHPHP
jgi:hypothetical protein